MDALLPDQFVQPTASVLGVRMGIEREAGVPSLSAPSRNLASLVRDVASHQPEPGLAVIHGFIAAASRAVSGRRGSLFGHATGC